MLTIAEITETCGPVGRYENWNQRMETPGQLAEWERNFTPDELDVAKAWFDRLATECRGVNEHVPTGQLAHLVLYWYEKAAAAGNPIAQLHMLYLNPPSEENRRSMAVLLNGAITGQTIGTAQLAGSSDYRLYDLALGFFYKYPAKGPDSSDVVRETWGYLACLHNKECNASERRDYFDTQYSPADATAILEAAELLERGGTKNVDFLTTSAFEAHEEE